MQLPAVRTLPSLSTSLLLHHATLALRRVFVQPGLACKRHGTVVRSMMRALEAHARPSLHAWTCVMTPPFDFRQWARRTAEWCADYLGTVRERRVRAGTAPGAVAAQLPDRPPEKPEAIETVFADFERIVLPGMTHWQHPRFFAYFPANNSPPSIIAEFLTATLAAQCMLWQTSPAATELESRVLDWLRIAIGLGDGFHGVIQDSASTATLCAVLTMRERSLDWQGNVQGLSAQPPLRIYCSDQVHSSIDKAVWIAGVGQQNLVRIPVEGVNRAMDCGALDEAIEADRRRGLLPAGIIASVGATGVGATDSLDAVCEVAERHSLYVHVDAAWAGTAMICPEFRHYIQAADRVDSFVFNPHKWLGVNFDCSAHFVRSPDELVRTLAIQPEYLKTHGQDGIINYSEWSVPLGRRFRALKLWFVLRCYGLEGLREMVRNHVRWAEELAEKVAAHPDFEVVTPPMLTLFSFRYAPSGAGDLDALNLALVNAINDDGRTYLTQTRLDGRLVIRFNVGQWDTTREDVRDGWRIVQEIAQDVSRAA